MLSLVVYPFRFRATITKDECGVCILWCIQVTTTKGKQMVVGSQLQDKIHEKGKYGRGGRTWSQ